MTLGAVEAGFGGMVTVFFSAPAVRACFPVPVFHRRPGQKAIRLHRHYDSLKSLCRITCPQQYHTFSAPQVHTRVEFLPPSISFSFSQLL